jgi:hypothetical protein
MAVGRVYRCVIDAMSVSIVNDLLWIGSPTDAVTYIEEIAITQDASETSEQLPLMLFRTATDQSTSGTALTCEPIEFGEPAYGGTVRQNLLGSGSPTPALSTETNVLLRESQNVLNGWHWKGSYEEPLMVLSPTAGAAGRACLKLDTAPAAALTLSGYVVIREIGG